MEFLGNFREIFSGTTENVESGFVTIFGAKHQLFEEFTIYKRNNSISGVKILKIDMRHFCLIFKICAMRRRCAARKAFFLPPS